MTPIHRDIFKAIHEGRWLTIEYRNSSSQITRYWIGILDLNVSRRSLCVEGLHLGQYTLKQLDTIYIDSILSSRVLEGSYCPVNENLVRDIHENPHKYKTIFDQVANLKILDYLENCSRMDTTPYRTDFSLVRYLDRDSFHGEVYPLDDGQFCKIVQEFQIRADQDRRREQEAAGQRNLSSSRKLTIQQLAMNVLSIHTAKGLYVLACRRLNLDVKNRCLKPGEDITVCTEFTVSGTRESIRRYLDGADYELLQDFEGNQERIKDAITRTSRGTSGVDDMPYVIGLGMDVAIDLHREYGAILEMYRKDQVPVPVRAFFGDLLDRPRSRRTVPITLMDRRINLDQLLAIDHAMKYPVAYVQGPPGTGKTNTIINTILTAFFNEKTVLFTAYNNHPIDGVVEKLTSLTYRDKQIPFPVIRLGNSQKVREALSHMRALYEQTKQIPVFDKTLSRNRDNQAEQMKRLAELLRRYEDKLDLKERSETIGRLLEYSQSWNGSMQMLPFEADLKGRQLSRVNRQMQRLGEITDEDALALLADDGEELKKYLYYTSVRYIQKLDSPGCRRLREILFMEEEEERLAAFQDYLGETENLHRFLQVFPVVATTCISAHRLGTPENQFDMTVMDEASQCNLAVGLVPVIRGKNLMLVGDPQQLNPVILLDEVTNQKLRKKYGVSDEYDYRRNSIYKAFLACDSVSDEVLLRYHYRCNRKIIEFNNQKYYNSRLLICSESEERQPLVYVNISDGRTDYKNTAPAEVEEIIRYAENHKDKSIGVITPFVNQRRAIEQRLKEARLDHVTCGTVHAFQGDEKDVVLFSTAITDDTFGGTYEWLKNNKELINVATSRAREQLIVLANGKNLERLHQQEGEDDLYDLVRYVRSNGTTRVTAKEAGSRALGIKPFSTETEEAFLQNLNHALENIWLSQSRFTVEKEVSVSHVFQEEVEGSELFYSGQLDFVVYEQGGDGSCPVLAIELDGKEHYEPEIVMARDRKKQEICKAHNLELIRVENSYARRYQHIKGILEAYFKIRH
ncbi:MAG: DUF2726 domain-containing protein [Lachnospiraceae bacterium]|nr:DUF2726 domain-containing protein [Lachnospiraceae bacterium]